MRECCQVCYWLLKILESRIRTEHEQNGINRFQINNLLNITNDLIQISVTQSTMKVLISMYKF